MQIHELTTFEGVPGDGDFLAIDNGTETTKVAAGDIINEIKVLVVEDSVSSLPKNITNAGITSDMVVLKAELGTPSAQTSDWDVETTDGGLTISGTVSGTTTVKLYLAKSK